LKNKLSITKAQATRSHRHRLKALLMTGSLVVLAGMIAWPYLEEYLEEKERKTLPKITGDHIDLEKKTVTNPRIIGTDGEGQPYVVTAASGEQIDKDNILLKQVKGTLTMKDGAVVMADANLAKTQAQQAESIYFYDTVHMTHDKANKIQTQDAHLDFKKGILYGENPIEGHGPDGIVSAQTFSFDYKNKILVLKGKASLTIFNNK
jgi:lipopolysaccharide export system protein LptC